MARPKKDQQLSIVIPVFNEAENFPGLYEALKSKIKTDYVMYVVYDFDEDNTVPVAKKYQQKDSSLKLVKNEIGRGPHNAIKAGFQAVEKGAALVIMADLSDDLSQVDEMYQLYLDGADVVCGSRCMKGGKQIGGPFVKRTLSRLAGNSLYYIRRIPTHDVTNNFKMYSKKLLDSIEIESTGGFEIAMEITVKAFRKRFKIVEIPTTWRDREAGEANFKLMKWLPKYLHWYFYALRPRQSKS